MTQEEALVSIDLPIKRMARVFPRITKATPQDELCFFGPPPTLFPLEADVVHV